MLYKKQLSLISISLVSLLVFVVIDGLQTEVVGKNCVEMYGSLVRCLDIVIFGNYQILSLFIFAILLALTPLFFTKENVYIAWRKFAVFALPAMALLVLLTPNSVGAGWINFGIDKETVSMFLSVVFLFVSWGLIAFKARHI